MFANGYSKKLITFFHRSFSYKSVSLIMTDPTKTNQYILLDNTS